MKIVYLAGVRIPNEKASGLAIMQQANAFGVIGEDVTLVRPYRKNEITEDPFVFYGMQPHMKLATMRSLDLGFSKLGWIITKLSQMLATIPYFLRADCVYSRDHWLLILPILFGKKTCYEAHQRLDSKPFWFVVRKATKVVAISNGLRDHLLGITPEMKELFAAVKGIHPDAEMFAGRK